MYVSFFSQFNPLSPEDFSAFEYYAQDVLAGGSLADAQAMLADLNALMEKQAAEIEEKSPQYYERYQYYWVMLAFKSFVLLDSADCSSILRSRLLYAVQNGFSPDQIIYDHYDLYESDDFVKSIFKDFAKDLEQNNEKLGTVPVEMGGKKLLPTIKYWIEDYAKFPSKVAKRGSVERLNYINQSVNARSLTQIQRQQLMKILKLYDDFTNAERPLNKKVYNQSIAQPEKRASDIKAPQNLPVSNMPEPKIDIQKKLNELKDRVR